MLYGIPAHKLCVIEKTASTSDRWRQIRRYKDGNTITFLGRLEERKELSGLC